MKKENNSNTSRRFRCVYYNFKGGYCTLRSIDYADYIWKCGCYEGGCNDFKDKKKKGGN